MLRCSIQRVYINDAKSGGRVNRSLHVVRETARSGLAVQDHVTCHSAKGSSGVDAQAGAHTIRRLGGGHMRWKV